MRNVISSSLAVLAVLAMLAAPAAADPARCTITRIKDKDVWIDIPITEKLGPETLCKTHAQRRAKQYALEYPVCAHNAREPTFSVTVVWHADHADKTFEVKAYCPAPSARK